MTVSIILESFKVFKKLNLFDILDFFGNFGIFIFGHHVYTEMPLREAFVVVRLVVGILLKIYANNFKDNGYCYIHTERICTRLILCQKMLSLKMLRVEMLSTKMLCLKMLSLRLLSLKILSLKMPSLKMLSLKMLIKKTFKRLFLYTD